MYDLVIDDEGTDLDLENDSSNDEQYMPDERMDLRPLQFVQSKLMRLMPGMAVPVSSLHTSRDTRRSGGVR